MNDSRVNEPKAPRVSVIIPLYNDALYFRNSLKSVLDQTLVEIEIIIVDDCSTDGSLEIAEEYAGNDSRITIIRQQSNLGGGAARNEGMRHATGEYLSFLDSDDYFYPTMLEHAYHQAKKADADICVFRCRYAVGKTPLLNWNAQNIPVKESFAFDEIKGRQFETFNSVPWNKLFRRTFAESTGIKWSETFCSNDVLFVNAHMVLASRITSLDEILVRYENKTANNSESKYRLYFRDAMGTYASLKNLLEEKGRFTERIKKSYCSRLLSALNWQFDSIKDKEKQEEYFLWLLESGFKELGIKDANFEDFLISDRLSLNRYFRLRAMATATDFKTFAMMEFPELRYVPVAYAINRNYALPFSVSLVSLLENACPDTFYDVFVLTEPGFPEEIIDKVRDSISDYENFHLRFIQVNNDSLRNIEIKTSHLSVQCFYRLLLPSIMETADRVVYLDCDTIVCGDLSELASVDMDENYVMGVKAAAFMAGNRFQRRKREELGIPSMDQYVNSGVLLMNLKKIRWDALDQRFLELTGNNYSSEDQDVLNVACYGKIGHLPLKFNAMIKYLDPDSDNYSQRRIYPTEELKEALNEPVIIHYANKTKPWGWFDLFWADIWLKYAPKSKLFNEADFSNYEIWQIYTLAGEYDHADLPHQRTYPEYEEIRRKETVLTSILNTKPREEEKEPDAKAYSYDSRTDGFCPAETGPATGTEADTKGKPKSKIYEDTLIKLSVVITIFNQEKTLPRTLRSLVSNLAKLGNGEGIIIDDCSSDRSLDVAAWFAARFPNLRIIALNHHSGSGRAKNEGLRISRGRYVTFLQSGDEYCSYESLRLLYDKAEENRAMICGGMMAEKRDDHYIIRRFDDSYANYLFRNEGYIDFKDCQFDLGLNRFIFRRSFLEQLILKFPEMVVRGDQIFLINALFQAERFYGVNEFSYIKASIFQKLNCDELVETLREITSITQFAVENGLNQLLSLTVSRLIDLKRSARELLLSLINQNNSDDTCKTRKTIQNNNFDLYSTKCKNNLKLFNLNYKNCPNTEFQRTLVKIQEGAWCIKKIVDSRSQSLKIDNEEITFNYEDFLHSLYVEICSYGTVYKINQ